ncbi:Nuclease precursor [compost metagenome]
MKKILMMAALCALAPTMAMATNCSQFYLDGQPPHITVPMEMNKEICYSQYSIGYNYSTKSALYTAQTLTKQNVLAAKKMERFDNFHDDPNLPVRYRVDESAYRGSMLDRGHLAPNKDFGDSQAQFESFSMANMVPQLHQHNAGIWLGIETAVRGMAMKYGQIQVVTGGVYAGTTRHLRDGIPVPNAMYKAVYIDNGRQAPMAAAYLSNNDASGSYRIISIDQLTSIIGIDVFPSGNEGIKAVPGKVYKPQQRNASSFKQADAATTVEEVGIDLAKKLLHSYLK